jgi:hypothetical protein
MLSYNLRIGLLLGGTIFTTTFISGLVTTLHKPADPAQLRNIISTSATSSCVKSMHNDPRVSQLKEATIGNYCSCATTKAVAQYTDVELLERDRKGPSFSYEDKARFTEAAEQCFDLLAQK